MPPTVKNCCCCLGLRLGCIIIGALGLIGTIGALFAPSKLEDEEISRYLDEHKGWSYFLVALFIFTVIFKAALLVGAIINNRTLVISYVFAALILTILEILYTIFICIATSQYASILAIIVFVIPFYFIVVAYSYYLDMESRLP